MSQGRRTNSEGKDQIKIISNCVLSNLVESYHICRTTSHTTLHLFHLIRSQSISSKSKTVHALVWCPNLCPNIILELHKMYRKSMSPESPNPTRCKCRNLCRLMPLIRQCVKILQASDKAGIIARNSRNMCERKICLCCLYTR